MQNKRGVKRYLKHFATPFPFFSCRPKCAAQLCASMINCAWACTVMGSEAMIVLRIFSHQSVSSAKTVQQSPQCGSVSKSRLLSMRCRCYLALQEPHPIEPTLRSRLRVVRFTSLRTCKACPTVDVAVASTPWAPCDRQRCLEMVRKYLGLFFQQLAASSFLPTFCRHMAMYISTSWKVKT